MKSRELLEKYPKAAEAVLEFHTNLFRKTLESADISPEFKEFAQTQVLDTDTVADLIDTNPRGTFDVFDANGIYITTPVSAADGPHFRWEIQTDYENVLTEEHETYSSEFLNTRKEAETAAIEKAFEILNNKL